MVHGLSAIMKNENEVGLSTEVPSPYANHQEKIIIPLAIILSV